MPSEFDAANNKTKTAGTRGNDGSSGTPAGIVNVVDDDPSLRDALSSLFRSIGLEVRLYGSADEFLAAGEPDQPSCVVLDVRLPGISGLDLQSHLRQRGLDIPIVMMTGHGDIPMSVRAMKAGAADFLPKPFRDQEMLDAVSKALERDRIRRLESSELHELERRYASLSPRERQVMSLVTKGKMNKQIAGDLDVSEVTVKIHRGSAMKKMGARSLAELVLMANRLGAAD